MVRRLTWRSSLLHFGTPAALVPASLPYVNKMKKLLIALAACPLFAQGCSFAPGYNGFLPSAASFEAKMDGDHIALLPAPTVTSVKVKRGTASAGASCDDAGRLTLDVNWPLSSTYKLNEVGFYFRVVRGKQPDQIFPLEPVYGEILGQRAQFLFVWLDGHPSDQSPLNLEIEVFAVNKGLQIGPSQKFRVANEKR